MKSLSRRKTSAERRDELFIEMMCRDRSEKESTEKSAREQQERRDLLVRACNTPLPHPTPNLGRTRVSPGRIMVWDPEGGNWWDYDFLTTGTLPEITDEIAAALKEALGEKESAK